MMGCQIVIHSFDYFARGGDMQRYRFHNIASQIQSFMFKGKKLFLVYFCIGLFRCSTDFWEGGHQDRFIFVTLK